MVTRFILFVSTCSLLVLGGLIGCGGDSCQNQRSTKRNIAEFVEAQGEDIVTIQSIEVDGTNFELQGGKLFIWGGTNSNLLFRVDYAGTDLKGLNDYLKQIDEPQLDPGTRFEGTITEESIAEGRTQVTVNLKTHNALSFVVDGTGYPETCTIGGITFYTLCPAVFGYSVLELAQGMGDPVLGESELQFQYTAPDRGLDIPDAVTLLVDPTDGFAFGSLTLHAEATGNLRSTVDDGTSEGVPALATVDVEFRPAEKIDTEVVNIDVSGRPINR
jgi:hypothetical protein